MNHVEDDDLMTTTCLADAKHAIVKRDGRMVPFRRERIFKALEAAFRDTKKIKEPAPLIDELHQTIEKLTAIVSQKALKDHELGHALTVEGIQDLVEKTLMEHSFHDVVRDYIIYREQHKILRKDSPRSLTVQRRDGLTFVRFNPMKIASAIERAFRDTKKISGISPPDLIDSVNTMTNRMIEFAMNTSKTERVLHVELIQDEI